MSYVYKIAHTTGNQTFTELADALAFRSTLTQGTLYKLTENGDERADDDGNVIVEEVETEV